MERHAMIIGIKKEKIEEYKKYHKNPWPEIKDCITKSNIKKFSIYIHNTTLFGYFEYYGKNLKSDMQLWADNSKMQEWWEIHIPMLEPIEKGTREDGWIYMEEIFHTS
jgi:L-rhamnose mutarotase